MDLFEREIRFIKTALKASAPHIVHAHWTYEFAEAAVRSSLPHVVTMHDLGWDYLRIYRDPYRAMRLLMKYRVMLRVRNLTVVAPFMAKRAWQYGYFGHVDVVPNGLMVPPRLLRACATHGPDWRPKLFTIGNPGPIKNVRASVEAFRLVRREFPGAELHLFGPGLDTTYATGEPGVVGHGNVDHGELMRRLENEATLLIHPSRLETFGMIIAEAKARGVPVVGGENSGGVAFVCGNAGAVTTDIESPQAIANAVIALLASQDKLKEDGDRARDDAAARFDIREVAQLYLDVYERILSGRGGRRTQ